MKPRRLAAACCLALWASVPLAAREETVQVDLPERVVVEDSGLGDAPSDPSRPVAVAFRQALLASGRALRLSVRLEDAPPGCRLLFTTRNARGGIGRSGRAAEDGFVPVFESFPRSASGGVEISWTLERAGEERRAGRRTVTLRWRVESVPVRRWDSAEPGSGGPPQPVQSLHPGLPRPERRERERPERPGHHGARPPQD